MKKTMLSLSALLTISLFAAFSLHSPAVPSVTKAPSKEFKEFLKQFKPAGLPYAISKEALQQHIETGLKNRPKGSGLFHGTSEQILSDPNHFLPQSNREMLSRSPVYKTPVAQLATTTHVGVIYASFQGYSPSYKNYQVAVFTKAGNLVASHNLAFTNVFQLMSATVNPQLEAKMKTYRINWERDIRENGTEGNRISSLSLEGTEMVNLTEKSKDTDFEGFQKKQLKKEGPKKTTGAK